LSRICEGRKGQCPGGCGSRIRACLYSFNCNKVATKGNLESCLPWWFLELYIASQSTSLDTGLDTRTDDIAQIMAEAIQKGVILLEEHRSSSLMRHYFSTLFTTNERTASATASVPASNVGQSPAYSVANHYWGSPFRSKSGSHQTPIRIRHVVRCTENTRSPRTRAFTESATIRIGSSLVAT
jgi:hypothetical protein